MYQIRSRSTRLVFSILIVALLFLSNPVGMSVAAKSWPAPVKDAGVPETICITSSPDISKFPEMLVSFRVVDSTYSIVPGLSKTDIQVVENNKTPISSTNITASPDAAGLNLYFVIDVSNRTDLTLVKQTMEAFSSLLKDGLDQVTILTDENNSSRDLLKTSSSVTEFEKMIQTIPSRVGKPSTINNALTQALTEIKSQKIGCNRSTFLIILAGSDTLSAGSIAANFVEEAKNSHTKVIAYNYPAAIQNPFVRQPFFETLTRDTYGTYVETITADIAKSSPGKLGLDTNRLLYTANYRSNNGDNGEHTVKINYQNQDITTESVTYSIKLDPPVVIIKHPEGGAVIKRTEEETTQMTDVEFTVTFPDDLVRKINSANLIVSSPTGVVTDMKIDPSTGIPLNFNWDALQFAEKNVEVPLTLTVEVTDEFGLKSTSQPVSVSVIFEIIAAGPPPWQLYVLYGIVGVLLLVIIIMWRQVSRLASGIGQSVAKVAGQIRQTIVGGSAKKGTVFGQIKVIDGPASMINQDLKIYTESVKLGRDPQRSDLSFYTVDANSSVSGLHCKIERVGGAWRIIALSTSGSETFVDNQPIPFNEPYPLSSGQTVRMGYLAQQPVEFTFSGDEIAMEKSRSKSSSRITELDDDKVPSGLKKIVLDKEEKQKIIQGSQEKGDDPFAKYRK